MMERLSRLGAFLLLAIAVGACGFALRGPADVPFDTLYINVPANSLFGAQLRRQMRASAPDVTIVAAANEAEVRLEVLDIVRDRLETSLNAQGRVQEYELTLHLRFQVTDRLGEPLIPDTLLSASRLLPWDDNVAQAKETEADSLYQAMQSDLAQRILRRLDSPDLRAALLAARQQTPTAGVR